MLFDVEFSVVGAYYFLEHQVSQSIVEYLAMLCCQQQLADSVVFAVGKYVEYFLPYFALVVLLVAGASIVDAHVALSAFMGVLLAEIAQQLSAAAYRIVHGIVHHGFNAVGKLLLALLIDRRRNDEVVGQHTVAGLGDERYGALWYETDNMALAQTL